MEDTGGAGRARVILVVPLARLAMAVAALALVGGAGLAGYWAAAGREGVDRLFTAPPPQAPTPYFHDLPDVIVNLHPDMASRYLKIGVTIASDAESRARVERATPALMNALQEFLRNLDQRDLQGSAGLHRLRGELRRRFALIVGEDAVGDVLLRSVLTQ